jgi:hypothetical protein
VLFEASTTSGSNVPEGNERVVCSGLFLFCFQSLCFLLFFFSLVLLRTKDIEKEKNSNKKKRVCFCLNKQSKDFFFFPVCVKNFFS